MLIRAIRVGIQQVVAQLQIRRRLVKHFNVDLRVEIQEARRPLNLLREL